MHARVVVVGGAPLTIVSACLRISTIMRELRRNGALPILTDAVQQALKVPPRKRNDNACNVIIDAFPALFDQLDKRLAMRIASEVHLQHVGTRSRVQRRRRADDVQQLPSLSVMMQQGAPADKAFVLASGTVAVHERRDSVSDASGSIGDLVCELSPGNLLGMEMINGGRFQSTVVTRTKCDVVVVDRHSVWGAPQQRARRRRLTGASGRCGNSWRAPPTCSATSPAWTVS